ncbi:putative phosphate transport regulator [Desulfovibrio sp. X2]|uniref:DUF47 domain-containing protein n=1 Tax=Desulfovibrio sp. X2 TaxID=941449 RepID=UPI000358C03F|nr:DUF47 family protein [Desulfovibrio sp. X2]EPR43785.1 putative phosphate transport regulator [Desulfovibrio sp. X2]
MGFSLFPKTVKFYELFDAQNRKLVKAAGVLFDIFNEFEEVEQKCMRINIVESEGNKICRDISTQLAGTFITPIDREDIHEINLTQEHLLNLMKAISTRVGLYDVERIKYPARKLMGNLRQMIEETSAMLGRLATRKGFEVHLEKVKALKYDSETILLVALGELYDDSEKTAASLLEIIKWSHLYDRIEEAVNAAEALADILEGVMVKNA